MKKTITHIVLAAAMILTFANAAFSQSFNVLKVDSDDFPTVRAYFQAMNRIGEAYSDLDVSEFSVLEDGISRDATTTLTCDKVDFFPPISVVLVVDVSPSMSYQTGNGETRLAWAKFAVSAFVDSVKFVPGTAVAILPFAGDVVEHSGFQESRQPLKDYFSQIVNIPGSTNFDPPFLAPNWGAKSGAVELLKTRPEEIRRVIIFLTDGVPEQEFHPEEVIDKCKEADVQVFTISLLSPINSDLDWVSVETGGNSYRIDTKEQLTTIYQKIAGEIQSQNLCWLEWLSEFGCTQESRDRSLEITFSRIPKTANIDYTAPESSVARIEADNTDLYFGKVGEGTNSQEITLTAKVADFDVTGYSITPDNGDFMIDWGGTPPPFQIAKDASKVITVNYVKDPPDASQEFFLELETGPCPTPDIRMIAPCGGDPEALVEFNNVPVGTTDEKTIECIFKNTTAVDISGDAQLAGPDAANFTILEGSGPFTLQPDACLRMQIEFDAADVGTKTAKIVYNIPADCGAPETQITGEGITTDFPMQPLSFGDHRVLTEDTQTYSLRNNSPANVTVSSIAWETGTPDFAAAFPSTPFDIAAGASVDFDITYTPQTEAAHEDYISINIQTLQDPVSARISGNGILPKIRANDLSIGSAKVAETVSGDLIITNPSITADLEISEIKFADPPSEFSFASGAVLNNITVDKNNGEHRVEIEFTPQSAGMKTADVIIISDAVTGPEPLEMKTSTVTVSGQGLGLNIAPLALDFGRVLTCETNSKTLAVTITNDATETMTIDNVAIAGADAANFSYNIVKNNIPASESSDIEVTFNPDEEREYSASMNIETSSGSANITLDGEGYKIRHITYFEDVIAPEDIEFKSNTLFTQPGFTNMIRFKGFINQLGPTTISSIKYIFDVNSTLINYEEGTFSSEVPDDWNWTVETSGNQVLVSGSGPAKTTPVEFFHTIGLTTYLGNHYFHDMTVIASFDASLDCLVPENDLIRVQIETCNTQGRMITFNAEGYYLKAPAPNPSSDKAKIEFSLGLDAFTRLYVYNSMGEIVLKAIEKQMSHGIYKFELPLAGLPAGIYFYRLQSGPYEEVKQMIITK